MTAPLDAINCAAWLADKNVQAFLRMIRVGEGTSDDAGYRRLFGGDMADGYDDHPRRAVTKKLGGRPITSTAAGAYQFLSRTWDECVRALNLPDFSVQSQDLAAVYLIARRRAIHDVIAGRVEQAIAKCAREWASLPGSPYGQPTKTLPEALKLYAGYGGRTELQTAPPAPEFTPPAAIAATTQEPDMPLAPFIAAALPSLIEYIPKLGKLFGSGSQVAERNVAAAQMAVSLVQDAVGAKNAQEAVEILAADPSAITSATKAIEDGWFQLVESGGGGIDGARKHDALMAGGAGMLHSPSFWIGLVLLVLVFLLVLSLIGIIGTATWSDDVRAGLAGSIVSSVIGGLVGYYFGQTTSRNRTPAP